MDGAGGSHYAAELVAPRRRSFFDRLKWVLACLGVFFGFFFLMTLGATLAYCLESDVLVTDLGIDFEQAWEIVILSESADLRASTGGQLAILAVFLPLWLRVRRRGYGAVRREGAVHRKGLAALGIVVAGVGLQILIAYVLGLVLQQLPDLAQEYDEVYTEAESEVSFFSMLTVVVMAPVVEEISCRGLMFEFLMRAFDVRWSPRTGALGLAPSPVPVVAAIFFQALVFGIMHLNIVQGCYALLIGLVCGLAYWRTGSLLYSMALHLTLNLSSYLIDFIDMLLMPFGYMECIAAGAFVSAAGVALFMYTTQRWERALALRPNGLD